MSSSVPAVPVSKEKKRQLRKEFLAGLGFILPSFLGFFIFTLIPVVMSLGLNFTEWNFLRGLDDITFNGLDNYIRLFSDSWFIQSFKNNILFTVITIPCCLALGLVFAELINKYVMGKTVIKVMFFIPYIASVVAVCVVWQVLLQPSYGPINEFLMALGIENPPRWLVDVHWALPTIMIIYIWQQVGYYIIVYLAGINNISRDIYEAAEIDGASGIRQFFSLTVPLVSPTTFFLSIMGIIGSFKVFDHISVLTSGGPGNATSVMAYYVYKTAFQDYKMGYANTLAWALFILIFLVTLVQWKYQDKFSAE